MHLFEFLLFLIVSHFESMSSDVTLSESLYVLVVTLLESLYVLVVTQFGFYWFLILRHELRRKLLNQAVPAR